jgi:dinuclear metal center YbgI/SA1388 family protein
MKKKERITRIQDLIGLVNTCWPPSLAEEWDNVGLQVGDPAAELNRVLVCLDPSEAALEAARSIGAQAILAHHPLIFRPLKHLTPGDETGRVLFAAVREGIAVLSAHTNLDRGAEGLNDWLARRVGLEGALPLATAAGELVKVVVFVPTGYEGEVSEALFRAGAGRVGGYDRCSFRTSGIGTFRPGPATSPFLGETGRTEQALEVRLETILPRTLVARAVERMTKAHPYEEVAYDLIPLANRRFDVGLGRIGRLPAPISLGDFAARIRQVLDIPALRIVGAPDRQVAKIAVCGGSGASLLGEAFRQGADVLLTGDVKYHEARHAESLGLALVDAGHFATERLMIGEAVALLRRKAGAQGLGIEFIAMQGEEDPFRTV